MRITISNAAGAALECQALAAHWYSFPPQRVAPGGTAAMAFAYVPDTGAVMDPASGLPVETLYCGWAGRAWATRSAIDIRAAGARAARAGGAVALTCRTESGAPVCR